MNWNLNSYFSEFNGPEMLRFKEALRNDIGALRRRSASLPALSDDIAGEWEHLLLAHEDLSRRMSHLSSYVSCLASADARNEAYLEEEASVARLRAEAAKIKIEFVRAVKGIGADVFARFSARPALAGAENFLLRLREEAGRAMGVEKESLATDLGVDGIQAWGRLYNTLSSKLDFDMLYPDGRRERVSMSQRRSLMDHRDRRVRRAAFVGGNDAWQRVEDVTAAAFNAIAGVRLTLNRHRGVPHFLEPALFQAAVSEKTLAAMLQALHANIGMARRLADIKARATGQRALAWYDLGAPLDLAATESFSWDRAKSMLARCFRRAYPALGSFFENQIVGKNWVDWEPRRGKRPGGFCTSSMLSKESRIFMTYNDSLADALTLAHETGHAFHGFVMRDVRPYARGYPMTLAETASTFAEQLLIRHLIEDPGLSEQEKAIMLDAEVSHGAIYLLDIPVRYEFEKAFYEQRQNGELSVSRLKQLMVETQRRILGDTLESGEEDPYLWASKLHFYITGLSFYNFPYLFGFLLSRALHAMFEARRGDFLPAYEDFLRRTASDTAENVVRHTLGLDLEREEFWSGAIQTLEEPLNRLAGLLPKVIPGFQAAPA